MMKILPISLKRHTVMILGVIFVLGVARSGVWAQDVKVPDDAPVKIEADTLSYDQERDLYEADGNVVVFYGDGILTAASVEYHRKTNLATARGNALLRMAGDWLQGDTIVVNVEDKTGVAYDSKAFYARNHFYIRGSRIEKTGENTYSIEEPVARPATGTGRTGKLPGVR